MFLIYFKFFILKIVITIKLLYFKLRHFSLFSKILSYKIIFYFIIKFNEAINGKRMG